MALREQVKLSGIQEIKVLVSKFTHFEIGSEPEKWDPRTRETADHSLPYIFARTLVDGPLRVSSFAEEKVLDPELRPLMKKIQVIVDDEIEAASKDRVILRAQAHCHDGMVHEVEVVNPLGHPDNPMQDKDIDEKFLSLAEPVLGQERSQTALAAWWRVSTTENIAASLRTLDLGIS